MKMAYDISTLSTCSRRQVGCIITNEHGVIIGSGYNGGLSGQPHCCDVNPTGDKEHCVCLHAEVNAVMNSSVPKEYRQWYDRIAYVTTFPCDSCMKLLVAFGVTTVVYDSEYTYFESSKRIAEYYGVQTIHVEA